MREIPLENIPNQGLETTIDNIDYSIQLRTIQVFTVADVYSNGKLICAGVRCVPGQALIPYKYLTQDGNFFFYCLNDDYPNYAYFGDTQKLVYLDDAEIASMQTV